MQTFKYTCLSSCYYRDDNRCCNSCDEVDDCDFVCDWRSKECSSRTANIIHEEDKLFG